MKPINKKKIILGSAVIVAVVIVLFCLLMRFRASAIQPEEDPPQQESAQKKDEEWEIAQNTPLGRYPETITYTLGKVTAKNNSNMPNGDTYEDNNYTRYVLSLLNVQNQDVMEGQDHNQYESLERMAVLEGKIPDIMVVTSQEILDTLVKRDLIQDLTEVYEKCASDRIKEMYESYGDDKLRAVTYDGKLMAFPETEVYTGPALLWLRKDWIDKLGLEEPQTLEEAMDIVREFTIQNPGKNPEGNVGLVFDPSLIGQSDQCFSLDPILDSFHAYPGKWMRNSDDTMVYGSVTENMKNALEKLHDLYKDGILDESFMIRNAKNLPQLLQEGQSGAFFGWWWAPNNPLSSVYDGKAEWKPYLFPDENQSVETSLSYGRHYCVVARKGFEYPEIIPKVLSALFDYARYDGKEEAEGVGEYLGRNVDPTATPFVINIDYSDAIFRTTNHIQEVLSGEKIFQDLTVLEQGYYKSCREYLDQTRPNEGYQWAAYTSRITAVSQLLQVKISYVNEGYTQEYDRLTDDKLARLAEETFIKIITGESSLSEFDKFVEAWYALGGQKLTEEANQILQKN